MSRLGYEVVVEYRVDDGVYRKIVYVSRDVAKSFNEAYAVAADAIRRAYPGAETKYISHRTVRHDFTDAVEIE